MLAWKIYASFGAEMGEHNNTQLRARVALDDRRKAYAELKKTSDPSDFRRRWFGFVALLRGGPNVYGYRSSYKRMGKSLTRVPVAAKTALPTAGATAIIGGSPKPVGNSALSINLMSSSGTSAILSGV